MMEIGTFLLKHWAYILFPLIAFFAFFSILSSEYQMGKAQIHFETLVYEAKLRLIKKQEEQRIAREERRRKRKEAIELITQRSSKESS